MRLVPGPTRVGFLSVRDVLWETFYLDGLADKVSEVKDHTGQSVGKGEQIEVQIADWRCALIGLIVGHREALKCATDQELYCCFSELNAIRSDLENYRCLQRAVVCCSVLSWFVNKFTLKG